MADSGQVSPSDLYQALKAAGIPPVAAAAFVSIAQRESGFRPSAFNGNTSTGDQSYGLFQVNLLNGGWSAFLENALGWGPGTVAAHLTTLQGSVAAAAAIYNHSGLNAWGGYKGVGWNHGTNPQTGVAASGGEVSLQQLEGFQGFQQGQSNTNLSTGGSTSGSTSVVDPAAAADQQQYGFLINDPQIGPLLTQLGTGAISPTTFESDIQSTDWWRAHSGSARSWEQLQSSDPASYQQQLRSYSSQIVEQAVKLGVGLDPGTILKLANQWGSENWSAQDLTNALVGYAKRGSATGGLANDMENVRQVADSYGVHLDEQTAWNYATQLAKNQQDANSLAGTFATQAKALFPNLSAQIDQGQTVAQIATPYVTAASKMLEVDPSQIDIADPKYQRALAFNDGKNVRQMSQLEWQQTLMSDPTYGWDRTMNARDSAVGLVQQLGQTFGYGN